MAKRKTKSKSKPTKKKSKPTPQTPKGAKSRKRKQIPRAPKVSSKELLRQLREAKKKEKQLSEYKLEKDSAYRREARKEGLSPTTDLNSEVREEIRFLKGNKGDIEDQKNEIKKIQKDNRVIADKIKRLKNEYPFADDERKKEIDRLLNSPDYRKKDVTAAQNMLNAISGKDFNLIIDNGFKKYKMNTKDLKKIWKQGGDISLPVLKQMDKDVKDAIKFYNNLIKKEKKTASKAKMKKLNRIKNALEKKLRWSISQNVKAIETGNLKELDKINEFGEKAYSSLFKVVGFNIDKITI